jgi:hypothetical protein
MTSCTEISDALEPDTNQPPQIVLKGNAIDTITSGVPYADPGAVAIDPENGDISDFIRVSEGTFSKNNPVSGIYQLIYSVKDQGGLGDSVTRIIVVLAKNVDVKTNKPPQLTLIGKAIDTIKAGVPYIDPGAAATDPEEGNLSDSIYVIDGTFIRNNPAAGVYQLIYFVKDSGGLSDSVTRTIVVVAGTIAVSDTVVIRDPVSGSNFYRDTTKIYLLPDSRLTIPSGASITFGKRVAVIALGKIYIEGLLVVDTGAVFLMGKDGCISTYTGLLKISGSDSLPVILKNLTPGVFWGTDPTTSNSAWASYGIEISEKANANSSIQFCIVDSATTGIHIGKDGLLLSDIGSVFNKYSGIYFDACGPKDSLTFKNILLYGNGTSKNYFPMVIQSEYLGRLSDSLDISNNAVDAVLVTPGIVTLSGIWKALSVPYVVNSGSYIQLSNPAGVVVTVSPGATFKFMTGAYLEVYNGTLIANGTSTKHIVFDVWVPGTYWGLDYGPSNYAANRGLYFNVNTTSLSSISYCDVNNSTQGLTSYDSPVHVGNSSFNNSKYYGLYATAKGNSGIDGASCKFSGNGTGAYFVAP